MFGLRNVAELLRRSEDFESAATAVATAEVLVEAEEAARAKERKAADRTWGGLFYIDEAGGSRRRAEAVIDIEDGVRRCGRCNWELEGGACLRWSVHTG
jgi:hypothetical protein